jgi:hypothetical protein
LKAQRAQADDSVQEIQESLDFKHARVDEVNQSLSLLKMENAKLRLAVCPSGQKAVTTNWAAGHTPIHQQTHHTICNTPASKTNGVEIISAVIHDDFRESSAPGTLSEV